MINIDGHLPRPIPVGHTSVIILGNPQMFIQLANQNAAAHQVFNRQVFQIQDRFTDRLVEQFPLLAGRNFEAFFINSQGQVTDIVIDVDNVDAFQMNLYFNHAAL